MKRLLIALTCLAWFAALAAEAPPVGRAFGSPNAPIKIELFSDFQCPSCKALHEDALRKMERDFVDKGKVYLIHYEFPIPYHKYARLAASYACAAAHIGKYDPVADALFRNQRVWEVNGQVEQTVASALTPAEMTRVRALAESPEIAAEIQKDIELARATGINSTPTMVVRRNSVPYPIVGAVNYDLLRRFLEELLAK
jgi:protein-disulfide isomerase